MTTLRGAAMLERVDAAHDRLAAHVARRHDGLTAADPGTGEQWTDGDIWAHCAEFIPYWLGQAEAVILTYSGEPVPFGRTKTDAERLAAIRTGRVLPATFHWPSVEAHIATLREFLVALDDHAFEARGVHPTLGEMSLERIIDEFMVGHLEEHAAQLDSLDA